MSVAVRAVAVRGEGVPRRAEGAGRHAEAAALRGHLAHAARYPREELHATAAAFGECMINGLAEGNQNRPIPSFGL